MIPTRLLIDLDAFEFLPRLPRRDQEALLKRFREIADSRLNSPTLLNWTRRAVQWMFTCLEDMRSSFGTTLPIGR